MLVRRAETFHPATSFPGPRPSPVFDSRKGDSPPLPAAVRFEAAQPVRKGSRGPDGFHITSERPGRRSLLLCGRHRYSRPVRRSRWLGLALITALFITRCEEKPLAGREIRDDLGRTVRVPQTIKRVVTLAPNLTELVYAVGGESKLVGTDDHSDFPPPAKRLPHVGGMQPSIERIVSLKPDLVLATTQGNHPSLAAALAAVRIPLYVVRSDRLDQIGPSMIRIGELLDAPLRGEAVTRLRETILSQRRRRTRPPRILMVVWADPLYVAGRNNFSDDLLHLCGAENAVRLDGWPQYSMEAVVGHPPDIIIYPNKSVSQDAARGLVARSGEKAMAVGVDENLFTRPGPRLGEAATALNAVIDDWERRF